MEELICYRRAMETKRPRDETTERETNQDNNRPRYRIRLCVWSRIMEHTTIRDSSARTQTSRIESSYAQVRS
jgi:hypothetical protein